MNGPQTRTRPVIAVTGRQVRKAGCGDDSTATWRAVYGNPRDGYHGTTPPNPAPAPRDPQTIASELYQASECLADLAEEFAAGEYDSRALSAADALLIGCGRLICELRQRREVTP